MTIKKRSHSIPMPNLKTISEKTTKKHLFEDLHSEPWALKRYMPDSAKFRLTVDFDTVCVRNMVADYLVFKAYQCHVTIPTKLTIHPRTYCRGRQYVPSPCHMVIVSVIRSYGQSWSYSRTPSWFIYYYYYLFILLVLSPLSTVYL